jgi:hypothetical protein
MNHNPEVVIHIEDIYYKNDEEDKLEKKLLDNNKDKYNNSFCCYSLLDVLFYCFM